MGLLVASSLELLLCQQGVEDFKHSEQQFPWSSVTLRRVPKPNQQTLTALPLPGQENRCT